MERRKHSRESVACRVYFVAISADGREASQDIGMAKDISPGGMLLETAGPINTTDIRIMAAAADKKQLTIDGTVIYSMQVGEDRYNTGVFFPSGSPEA